MMKRFLIFFSCIGCLFSLRAEYVNILSVGGKNDGKTLNTEVIAKTIDRLSANGGGTLYFPAGTYLTGPITLKSHITLEIEAGAVLSFSDNFDLYMPYVEMRYEGVVMKSFHPLIYAYEAENIAIKGRGTLEGNGNAWWQETWRIETIVKKKEVVSPTKYQQAFVEANPDLTLEQQSDWKGTLARQFFRPPFIQLYKCKDILIEGLHIQNSPFWTVNPEFCENLNITGLTINNPISPNTDGINPSSCKNVHISNCHISVGDDCITIKSGRDLQGRQYGVPCENITITNCTMLKGHGGVVIGSEMSGDVRKVTISNCVFDGTDRGIRIKSTRGRGGVVEEIRVDNIVMTDIKKEAVILNLFYSNAPEEPVSERTPCFRNIHIAHLTGTQVKSAGAILGLPEMPVENVSFTDINMDAESGFRVQDARQLSFSNIQVNATASEVLTIQNSEEIRLSNIVTYKPLLSYALISMQNVRNVMVDGCFPLPGSKSFVDLRGDKNEGVVMMNNHTDRLTKSVAERPTADNHFRRPLKEVLDEMQQHFGIRLKYAKGQVEGVVVDYADYRLRQWSIEESLRNLLMPLDYKFVKNSEKEYEIKAFEYARRQPEDGQAYLDYLQTLYADTVAWNLRKAQLKKEMTAAAGLDKMPARPDSKIILTPKRVFDGYYVQNMALEILPGVYCTGSIYHPAKKGKCAIMLNPNGHFGDGRYRADEQKRCAMQAKMGIIAVSYDLFAWDEQQLQFDAKSHRTAMAHTIQSLNAIRLLDYLCSLKEADLTRVGITGGSGGGSQTMFITAIDDRITLSMPVVMTSSYFIGGCPCESGNPIHLCAGGTNNAEMAAMCAPRPLLIVSDGKDWTQNVPRLELPFIQRTYALYGKEDRVENVHFPDEGHDYGLSKRLATYAFLEKHWQLNTKAVKDAEGRFDESACTVEDHQALKVWGKNGERLPENAVHGVETLYKMLF